MIRERRLRLVSGLTAAIVAIALSSSAFAASKGGSPASLLPGGNSKEPISIEADKRVYFDKEQKAIYSGNVIAIQGDSKLTCSALTIFLAKNEDQATEASGQSKSQQPAPATAEGGGEPPSPSTSQVKHMEAAGPVTVVSKTQVATGDRGVFDKVENKVWLYGNVTLSDGGNVTKGDKLTYDMTTGHAVVEGGRVEGGQQRVQGLFIPSSNDNNNSDKSSSGKKKLPDNSAPKH
jgi:lipopolysaccharide export system protein LptA